jgi:predicted dehydrogenase
MMKKVLKVGIIGTGWISNQHINGYLQCDHVEIAAVADINENAAREVMRKYNLDCKYYSDYKKLLANSEIDAISICVPNAFHSEVTIAAAMAGKHIMAEKPFVSSIEESTILYSPGGILHREKNSHVQLHRYREQSWEQHPRQNRFSQ